MPGTLVKGGVRRVRVAHHGAGSRPGEGSGLRGELPPELKGLYVRHSQ